MKLSIKPLVLAVSLSLAGFNAYAGSDLKASRTVFDDRSQQNLQVSIEFPEAVTADVYLATIVQGMLLFFGPEGLTPDPVAFMSGDTYLGSYPVLDLDSTGIPDGRYPLFQVNVEPGGNVLDVTDDHPDRYGAIKAVGVEQVYVLCFHLFSFDSPRRIVVWLCRAGLAYVAPPRSSHS